MLVTVTPEMFEKGRRDYLKTNMLAKTCAMSQALMTAFPFMKDVGSGLTAGHVCDNLWPWTQFHQLNFNFGEDARRVVWMFDQTSENLEAPIQVEIFWDPEEWDTDEMSYRLYQNMQD